MGCTHLGFPLPATLAGQPKHTAIPNPPVSVGVANTRTKFVAAFVHKLPPAPGPPQNGPGINVAEVAGYTDGRQHGDRPQLVCLPVSAENTGTHSDTLSQSQIGEPNSVGSFHGARGAQFSGVAIHDQPPNQQLSH